MKDQKDNKQNVHVNPGQRDDIRKGEVMREQEKRENHPGKDRAAKTERKGMGQQQGSSGDPINS